MPTIPKTPYSLALREYHLRAAEWLGLDPSKVWGVKVHRGIAPTFTNNGGQQPEISWSSHKMTEPSRGHVGPWNAHGEGGSPPVFEGYVVVAPRDVDDFLEHIGPEPQMFTAQEKARLWDMQQQERR